ncbi:alkaline phosphatase family protein [Mycolicibacterium llatzerense]|uniref:alkaline phosphatase family protein n=1 Tax=Mycolicibacterium llatzerense TaxID=280871 RepID=UPI0013A6988B|nr:alkaline phosphatase family protein [Mycolicibacterium llatzerense]
MSEYAQTLCDVDASDAEAETAKRRLHTWLATERIIEPKPKYGKHTFDVTGPGDFTCGNSMHPLDDITRGEKLVKAVYEAIRISTHWHTSLLIVMFDEHGGFYDHVPPPAADPPGDTINPSYNTKGFKFDRFGVRVPALVISPWIRRGVIDHTKYDHTSMLATVERLFGMHHLTERDRLAENIIHLLSLSEPRTDAPPSLPAPATNPESLGCDDEAESMDGLLAARSELRLARTAGIYRERRIDEYELTPSQIGFAQIALLRVLNTARQPERDRWIEQYRSIDSGVDAAIFMIDAKLHIRYDLDFHRTRRRKGAADGCRRSTPTSAAKVVVGANNSPLGRCHDTGPVTSRDV